MSEMDLLERSAQKAFYAFWGVEGNDWEATSETVRVAWRRFAQGVIGNPNTTVRLAAQAGSRAFDTHGVLPWEKMSEAMRGPYYKAADAAWREAFADASTDTYKGRKLIIGKNNEPKA